MYIKIDLLLLLFLSSFLPSNLPSYFGKNICQGCKIIAPSHSTEKDTLHDPIMGFMAETQIAQESKRKAQQIYLIKVLHDPGMQTQRPRENCTFMIGFSKE
jgi:hypothetical protein